MLIFRAFRRRYYMFLDLFDNVVIVPDLVHLLHDVAHEHAWCDVVNKEWSPQLNELLQTAHIGQHKKQIYYLALVEGVRHVFTDEHCYDWAAWGCVIVVIVLDSVNTMELPFLSLSELEKGVFERSLTLTDKEVGLLLNCWTDVKEELVI